MEQFYEIIKEELYSSAPDTNFCVYIDFPFCLSKCKYCIYNSLPIKGNEIRRIEYSKALINQLKSLRHILEIRTPDCLYFGGGTPSLFTFDELISIKESIPNYNDIKNIKSEAHPIDLSAERIEFYSKELHMDIISLGVQSLDFISCQEQNRLWVSPELLYDIVQALHSHGIHVNIDLVALFNGDGEKNWVIFEDDLIKLTTTIYPDVITCLPNYKTHLNYFKQVARLRQILAKITGGMYYPPNKKMLSSDMSDIERYGFNDHWIATKSYWDYQRRSTHYNCSMPKLGHSVNQITLSVGGASNHKVYSYPSSINCICTSSYDC